MPINPIKNILNSLKGVGEVVDKFVKTPEEKAEIMAKIESEISNRWEADAKSDSFLAKNIRPLSLAAVLIVFFIMLFTDGNVGEFKIQKEYIPVFQILLITIVGGYFAVRTIDKKGKIK